MHKRERHGMHDTVVYNIWNHIRSRCKRKTHANYDRYGGRGITVCERWDNSFLAFYEDMGDPPDGMSIERIDNEKGYYKENCKWATQQEQAFNRRTTYYITYKGETKPLKKWCYELNIDYRSAWQRIKRGWTVEEAFEAPLLPRHPYSLKLKTKNAA